MKLRRLRSHPALRLEGRSDHFQSFWELVLEPGEQTSPHRHYQSEELLYLLSGELLVTVDQTVCEVTNGEVLLIPPRRCHMIRNPSRRTVRAISVESRLDLLEDPPLQGPGEADTLQQFERALETSAGPFDETQAIQNLVDIFNIGGRRSVELEHAISRGEAGRDGELRALEDGVMSAVLEIARRYQNGRQGEASDS